MLYKTHIVFSLFLLIIIRKHFFQFSGVFIVLCVILFSLLADIDSKRSFLGKFFLFIPIRFFTKHRGFMHSFLFIFLVFFVVYFFNKFLALFFLIGYSSHLFLDFFTKEGIPIFWPITSRKIGAGLFLSGGIFESVLFFLLLSYVLLNWKYLLIIV